VVITGRPGGWLPAGWPVKVFDLTALTDEQTDALITALNPTMTADERALVAGRSDGVPFYIEQVVAGLTETGVPEALYEPLFALLRASASVVPVVEAAAVIGFSFAPGLRLESRSVCQSSATPQQRAGDDEPKASEGLAAPDPDAGQREGIRVAVR
jgi:hypothetical protein